MGQELSSNNQKTTEEKDFGTFQVLNQYEDEKFGQVQLVQNPDTKEKLMLKELMTTTDDDYRRCIKEFTKKSNLEHKNLVQLVGFTSQEFNEFCGKSYKLFCYYEFYNRSLEQEIIERQSQKSSLNEIKKAYFTENEMVKLLVESVDVLAYLQLNKIPHGDLRIQHIMIQDDCTVKISDHGQFKKNNAYLEILGNPAFKLENIYVSPQQMKGLKNKTLADHNVFKSDVFQLGIILLHAASLECMDDCFNYKSYFIDEDKIHQKIENVRGRYSDLLLSVIFMMIQFDEDQRKDFVQLNVQIEKIKKSFMFSHQKDQKLSKNQHVLDGKAIKNEIIEKNSDQIKSPILIAQNSQQIKATKNSVVMHGKQMVYQSDFGRIDGFSEDDSVVDDEKRPDSQIQEIQLIKNYSENQTFYVDNSFKNGNKVEIQKSPSKQADGIQQIEQKLQQSKLQMKMLEEQSEIMQDSLLNSQKFESVQEKKLTQDVRQRVVETFQNGSRYEGEKMFNKRNGKGRFFYADGGLYDGYWKNNKMNGYGVLHYATGAFAYQGMWEDDKFHGKGTLYNEFPNSISGDFNYKDLTLIEDHWTKYQGEFKNDYKQGKGVIDFLSQKEIYLSNGDKFVGLFESDQINGEGTYYPIKKQPINGVWKDNIKI